MRICVNLSEEPFKLSYTVNVSACSDGCILECGGLTPLFLQPGLTGCTSYGDAGLIEERRVKPPHSI